MSKLSNKVYNLLQELFPHNSIQKEYYVKFKGSRLFFDFFIKELSVVIEVQGRQHSEYIKHFHVDREGFLASKRRDNLKKEYCEQHDLVLVEIEDDISKDDMLEKIWSGMNND